LKYTFSIPSLLQLSRVAFFASKPSPTDKLSDYFQFPRHEEYFQDEYYNDDQGMDIEKEKTGVLKKYKKQLQMNEEDIRIRTFRQEFEKYEKKSKDFFVTNTPDDLGKFTKNYELRKRMRKPIEYTEEFREKNMRNEYGNYEKYQKNFAEIKNEEIDEFDYGNTNFVYNFQKFLKSSNLEEGDLTKEIEKFNLQNALKKGKNPIYDIVQKQRKFESDLRKEIDYQKYFRPGGGGAHRPPFNGRVSPWAKEDIYRLYLQGMTIKDLSLKFGLLPERIKFIVYARALFWTEIYPKVGETVMRLGIEKELMHAQTFPFIDYGKDLDNMAIREQGIPDVQFKRSEMDANPPPAVKAKIEKALSRQRSRKYDLIPERLIGKGPRAYLLYDWHIKRGKGAMKPSPLFAKTVLYGIAEPNMLPKRVEQRLKKTGPRIATLGYGLR